MESGDIAQAIKLIGRLESIPTILEVVARTTGMGFTAVAKVTEWSWTACAVHDRIDFGIKSGDELELGTTICNEIRNIISQWCLAAPVRIPTSRPSHAKTLWI